MLCYEHHLLSHTYIHAYMYLSIYLQLKEKMIRDTILLVDPLPYDRDALVDVLKRRLGNVATGEGGRRGGGRGGSTNNNRLFKGNGATTTGGGASALHRDLQLVLKGRRPRMVGEMPTYVGGYERMCPNTEIHRQVMMLKRRYVKKAPSSSSHPS